MSDKSKRSGTLGRILENAVWLLAGKGVGAVLSLVYLGLATRTLGPTDFGQFVLVLGTAQTVGSLVGFQTWQLVVRYGMEHLQAGRREAIGRLVSFSVTLDLGAALAGCGLAALGVMLLGPKYGWDAEFRLQALLFSFVMLLTFRSTAVGILRLSDRFGMGAAADAVTPATRLAGALVAVATGATVTGFLLAWAVAEVATATVYWLLAARIGKGAVHWSHWKLIAEVPKENPGLLRFAAITNMGSTMASISNQFTVLMVGLFVGPVAAGAYRLAHQLGQALATLAAMMSRAIFAELTRAHFGTSKAQLSKLFRDTSKLASVAGALIILILLVAGEPALRLLAGNAYVGAYPLLLLLGAAAALDVGGVSYEPALMATARAGLAFWLRLIGTAMLLMLLAILLPTYGAIGAAIATLIASFVGLILFGVTAWRAIHCPSQLQA